MNITKVGWKCDLCGREYYKNNAGFEDKTSVKIDSENTYNPVHEFYEEVCGACMDDIFELITKKQN
jgi:hypothetical protein